MWLSCFTELLLCDCVRGGCSHHRRGGGCGAADDAALGRGQQRRRRTRQPARLVGRQLEGLVDELRDPGRRSSRPQHQPGRRQRPQHAPVVCIVVPARRRSVVFELLLCNLLHTDTHTHPFNGPLSGTTQVSRYQKGKTNLDFTESRDSEWQWHQQICKSASRSRQITTTAPHRSVFFRPDAHPTNSIKALKA